MKKVSGFSFLFLSLYAFGGLGLEALLGFLIEPAIYGTQMNGIRFNISFIGVLHV